MVVKMGLFGARGLAGVWRCLGVAALVAERTAFGRRWSAAVLLDETALIDAPEVWACDGGQRLAVKAALASGRGWR